MKRFVILWYILIILMLPVTTVLLSGNLVLRVSETYVYHFNDSQVVDEVGSYVTGSEFAHAISGYFNSIGNKPFQVYEENGEFLDPIFDEDESLVMQKSKKYMTLGLLLGVLLMALTISLYVYLNGNVRRESLRRVGFISIWLSVISVACLDFFFMREKFRDYLYNKYIGIELNRTSTLKILLSSPFERTFIIFSTVLAIAIISLLLYIHSSVTREKRIFS